MTHQNYRMGFFLVIILDTILVYSELVLGIYITETETCHCEEEIIEEFPALDHNSTIPTVLETEHTPSYDSTAPQDNGKFDCDTLAKLTRSWKRSKISRSSAPLKNLFATLQKVCSWNYDLQPVDRFFPRGRHKTDLRSNSFE